MSATDELRPWWERLPQRVAWELANFADLGLGAELQHRADGAPSIHTTLALSDGREVSSWVSFPFEYPIKEPSVHVEAGLLGPPHEVGGGLCLFDNAPNQWNPDRSAAELVNGRVRTLLEGILVTGRLDPELEEQIPPIEYFDLVARPVGVVLVPDPFWDDVPSGLTQGAIAMVGKDRRRLLLHAEGFGFSEDLTETTGCTENLSLGRWIMFPNERRGFYDARELLDQARDLCPNLLDPVSVGKTRVEQPGWVALNFEGPGPRAGERRRRWSFVQLTGLDTVPLHAVGKWEAQALTLAERQFRTPELVGLETVKLALLGLGSLGSKVAIELAKASCGGLVLIDPDTYDVNNAVRHELPPLRAGESKATAVAEAVRTQNPFTKTEDVQLTLGQDSGPPVDFLRALDGCDLLIETTGARTVARLCERYGRIVKVPLLSASLTRGSRGGDMVFVDEQHCLDCFLAAQVADEIPRPEVGEERGPVVPIGCSSPAFSGSGFDSSELASAVARMAVRATGRTSYPALDHNWAVVNFVADPHWQQGTFGAMPDCRHLR